MNLRIIALLISFSILLSGCSWIIYPFIRNFETNPITMIISLKRSTAIDVNSLKAYFNNQILEMKPGNHYRLPDSLSFESIDSTTFQIVLPPISTTLIQIPHVWSTESFDIFFKHTSNKYDTLGKTVNPTVLNKKGEEIPLPIPFKKQTLFIDIRGNTD